MSSVSAASNPGITPEQYLAIEREAQTKHEYLRGEIIAMADASDAHVQVCGNVYTLLKGHLRGTECRVYMVDMKLRIKKGEAFFYPEVMVTCDGADQRSNYFKESPKLIIEVLSKTTEGFDRGEKYALYREILALKEYALINPHGYRVDLFSRNASGRWELSSYAGAEETVTLSSVGLSIPIRDLYEDVDFELATEGEGRAALL